MTSLALATAISVVLTASATPAAPAGTAVDQGAPAYYDSGLAPTPYMGWNTYYGIGAPTEKEVRAVADRLVSSGLRDSGYDIVWLDGGWQADRPTTPVTHKAGWRPTPTASPPASPPWSPTCTSVA